MEPTIFVKTASILIILGSMLALLRILTKYVSVELRKRKSLKALISKASSRREAFKLLEESDAEAKAEAVCLNKHAYKGSFTFLDEMTFAKLLCEGKLATANLKIYFGRAPCEKIATSKGEIKVYLSRKKEFAYKKVDEYFCKNASEALMRVYKGD